MRTHFLNGRFVPEEELLIPVRDLGFLRGYAVFDFLITYPRHRPFQFDAHLDRLFNSASHIGLPIPWSKEQIAKWTLETLEKNTDEKEKAIKIIITGGVSSSLLPGEPSIVILVDERHIYSPEHFTKGVGVITHHHLRHLPHAKSNNYIEGVRQAQRAYVTGAIEPIYYNDEQVFEGSTSNIFAVIDGKLVTPKTNILKGITRDVVLNALPIEAEERDFTKDELMRAGEAFLTASNKEVMPVTSIDGAPVGNGEVGHITQEVMGQFRDYTLSDKW